MADGVVFLGPFFPLRRGGWASVAELALPHLAFFFCRAADARLDFRLSAFFRF